MAPGPLGVGPSRGGLRQSPAAVCVLGGGASSLALPGPWSTKPPRQPGRGWGWQGCRGGGLPKPAHSSSACLACMPLSGCTVLLDSAKGVTVAGRTFSLKTARDVVWSAGRVLAQPTSNCQDRAEQTFSVSKPSLVLYQELFFANLCATLRVLLRKKWFSAILCCSMIQHMFL